VAVRKEEGRGLAGGKERGKEKRAARARKRKGGKAREK